MASKVIRASKIGFPCVRNIWLNTLGVEEVFDKKTLRIFDLGNLSEQAAVKWMREDGWDVQWNEGSQEAAWELEIPLPDGVIKGHPDCVITNDEHRQPILADIKSMNSRAYQYWTKGGTVENKLGYFVQVNIYAHAAGLDHVAIVGVNRDTADYTIEILDKDEEVVKETFNKAQYILAAKSMPPKTAWAYPHLNVTSEIPDWCCRYCSYKTLGLCDGKDKNKVEG